MMLMITILKSTHIPKNWSSKIYVCTSCQNSVTEYDYIIQYVISSMILIGLTLKIRIYLMLIMSALENSSWHIL